MHVNRGLVFWGLALVAAGTVALLIQSGAIGEDVAGGLWRFWPIALIASRTPFALTATVVAALVIGGLAGSLAAGWPSGLSIGCAGDPTERMTDAGTFGAEAAAVELDMNCGDLTVSTAPGDGWSVDARHGPDDEPRLTANDASLELVAGGGDGPFGAMRARQDWRVVLPSDVALDLDVDANAVSSRLDLSGADLSRLGLDINAGDVRLDLAGTSVDELSMEVNAVAVRLSTDATTTFDGEIGMNAGSLELCVVDDAAVEITLDDPNITFSHNLDDRGFTESGDTWRSGSGTPAIRLTVDGNAASFTVNPEGGCS